MPAMHAADIAVLVLYLVGIATLGVWMSRRIKSTADFFMPRKSGKVMMIMHTFGTGTSSDRAVSVASKTFTSGLSGIWYQWLWLFCTPFYWLIAPLMRRFRAVTTADVFEARYNRSVATLYAIIGTVNLMFCIGVMLKGSGAVVAGSTGQWISSNTAILLMTGMFVFYGVAGGLGAAIITDFIQGILTVVFSFLLLPFVLNAVGGIDGIYNTIPRAKEMFSLAQPGDIGTFYIAVIAFNGLVGIITQPHTMGNCAAGRTETDGRVGFMCGSFIKRICTVAWCLTGLAALAYFAGQDIDPDHVYGSLARQFLPAGLLGLFLVALLASVMSSCDSFMIASSGLFTENVYRPLVAGRPDRHYMLIGRITSVAIVAGGVGFAFWLPNVVRGLEIFWKIAPMMGISFWMGLYWRRTTSAGAWATTLTALGTWWLTEQGFFIHWLGQQPFAQWAGFVSVKPDGLVVHLPWQMIFYLAGGTLAGVVVSLLTPPVSPDKLERFYALTRTPVAPGEHTEVSCTLPEGTVVPPRRNLLPGSGFELPVPTRASVIGFLIGVAGVVGIIVGFMALMSRG